MKNSTSKKLAILHYMPLEYYPPIVNLLDFIQNDYRNSFTSVEVFSCHNIKNRKALSLKIKNKLWKIFRSPFPKNKDSALVKVYKYFHFNVFTLIRLIIQRPTDILYFETYSAWPAYFYTRYFNSNCKLHIHNHEYSSPDWYKKSMLLTRYNHSLEKKWLYSNAKWISQTNEDRCNLFANDNLTIDRSKIFDLPNYPPKNWSTILDKINNKYDCSLPIKIVYVGSLSLESTYLKEFCEWIEGQNGAFTFDIYTYNIHNDTLTYLNDLKSKYIKLYPAGVEYNDIPNLLSNYNVGVIFYKPYSENVINCVSNKFYEYLACDLDIWFSTIMESTKKHLSIHRGPKVIAIDFENLNQFDFKNVLSDQSTPRYNPDFYCENVYNKLLEYIVNQ